MDFIINKYIFYGTTSYEVAIGLQKNKFKYKWGKLIIQPDDDDFDINTCQHISELCTISEYKIITDLNIFLKYCYKLCYFDLDDEEKIQMYQYTIESMIQNDSQFKIFIWLRKKIPNYELRLPKFDLCPKILDWIIKHDPYFNKNFFITDFYNPKAIRCLLRHHSIEYHQIYTWANSHKYNRDVNQYEVIDLITEVVPDDQIQIHDFFKIWMHTSSSHIVYFMKCINFKFKNQIIKRCLLLYEDEHLIEGEHLFNNIIKLCKNMTFEFDLTNDQISRFHLYTTLMNLKKFCGFKIKQLNHSPYWSLLDTR